MLKVVGIVLAVAFVIGLSMQYPFLWGVNAFLILSAVWKWRTNRPRG
jgi:hypothetical protein